MKIKSPENVWIDIDEIVNVDDIKSNFWGETYCVSITSQSITFAVNASGEQNAIDEIIDYIENSGEMQGLLLNDEDMYDRYLSTHNVRICIAKEIDFEGLDKWEYIDLVIPEYSICYIFYNDSSGIKQEDIDRIDLFLDELPKDYTGSQGTFEIVSYEGYFSHMPEFGLACTCYDVKYHYQIKA